MTQKKTQKKENDRRMHPSGVSPVVIRRLPRYFRYLRELLREGRLAKERVDQGSEDDK